MSEKYSEIHPSENVHLFFVFFWYFQLLNVAMVILKEPCMEIIFPQQLKACICIL